jgi:hypothetical protein
LQFVASSILLGTSFSQEVHLTGCCILSAFRQLESREYRTLKQYNSIMKYHMDLRLCVSILVYHMGCTVCLENVCFNKYASKKYNTKEMTAAIGVREDI